MQLHRIENGYGCLAASKNHGQFCAAQDNSLNLLVLRQAAGNCQYFLCCIFLDNAELQFFFNMIGNKCPFRWLRYDDVDACFSKRGFKEIFFHRRLRAD